MVQDSTRYGICESPEDVAALTKILAWSFAAPEERLHKAWEKIGTANLRVLRDGSRIEAGYILHAMGQWFGGRRVSMAGVGMVGVAAEARGRGLATRLMDASIREFHDSGFAISVLYPAKQALYRRSGYERAGGRYRVEIDLGRLALADRPAPLAPLRAFTPADFETVRGLYDRWAARECGPIDRTPFLWDRKTSVPDQNVNGYLVQGEAGPEGYTFVYQSRGSGLRASLHVTDHVALTARAARTLLTFYADHQSMGVDVEWFGRVPDPFLMLLREARTQVELNFPWMIRIVDVERALVERGYAPGVETEVHFDVKDELIPSNAARFVLNVSGGRGEVARGGEGRIATGIHGLASIYSGFLTPEAAKRSGLLDGPEAELDRAALAFTGPPPWMPDMF